MSYTFSCHREECPDYPAVDYTYEVRGEFMTHMELCQEFYFFLRGCGFRFNKGVVGIGTIEQEE